MSKVEITQEIADLIEENKDIYDIPLGFYRIIGKTTNQMLKRNNINLQQLAQAVEEGYVIKKKPITFLEAVEEMNKGKVCNCEHNDCDYVFQNGMLKVKVNYNWVDSTPPSKIFTSKWYVK